MHPGTFFAAGLILLCLCCKPQVPVDTSPAQLKPVWESTPLIDYDTTRWTELSAKEDFLNDIRYATIDNFVKEKIYPCGRCFLKPSAAQRLMRARDELRKKGFRLKMFDCYRPAPAQQKLWDKVPDRDYVAPPSEGSMHNRGVAVDLTLTDLTGNELDMGTGYDFFGQEAHHDYPHHSQEVQARRLLLKSAMEAAGFQSIRTEWWHYSVTGFFPPIEKWQWPCP